METKFFIIFAIATIISSIILIKFICSPLIERYRRKKYADIDTQITAALAKEWQYYDTNKERWESAGRYEWIYNGKKHHTTFRNNGSYPHTMTITIHKKTGKYKEPEAERKSDRLNIVCCIVSVVIGYAVACFICGYIPLLS